MQTQARQGPQGRRIDFSAGERRQKIYKKRIHLRTDIVPVCRVNIIKFLPQEKRYSGYDTCYFFNIDFLTVDPEAG